MLDTKSHRHRHLQWLGYGIGVFSTIAVGLLLLTLGSGRESETRGGALGRFSYDFPFNLRHEIPPELVMVYVDETVKRRLGESPEVPLDRRYYVRLLRRLQQDGARLVLFDIIFDSPCQVSDVDEDFARVLREYGRAVLIADAGEQLQANLASAQVVMPTEKLREAAQCGLANVDNERADNAVRWISSGSELIPSVSVLASKMLGAELPAGGEQQWLNYYCPPRQLSSINLDQVLAEDGLSRGYFSNKLVVIGGLSRAGVAGKASDVFANPYSRFGVSLFAFRMSPEQRVLCNADSPGAAVHAFSLLNLIRGDWLTRMSLSAERTLIIVYGSLISLLLMRLHPWRALAAGLVAAAAVSGLGWYSHLDHRFWFAWAIPAFAQTPVALVWGISFQYFIESRRRQRLRRAFAAYLSPYMANLIAESDVDLTPGGKEVEATVLFTDLKGFTTMSEGLSPAEVSKLLISYFNKTTGAILARDGTVLKYIGDAVMAVWGAPLPQTDAAERAVIAAWGIQQAIRGPIVGRQWQTRIGINTGIVLAGNLGSDFRFDYTLIGDAVNIAARLEALNKALGTELLISLSTAQKLGSRFQVRQLGSFILAGKRIPVVACEVLSIEGTEAVPGWAQTFQQALNSWNAGDFDSASKMFRLTIEQRQGHDGPSDFYLAELRRMGPRLDLAGAWDGTVRVGKADSAAAETGLMRK